MPRGIPSSLFPWGVCISFGTALIELKTCSPMIVYFLRFAETSLHKLKKNMGNHKNNAYSIVWNVSHFARTVLDGQRRWDVSQKCFSIIHTNFVIFLEMTELKVDTVRFKKSPLRAFSREKFKTYFRTIG